MRLKMICVLLVILGCGCSGQPKVVGDPVETQSINHVVFIKLKKPGQAAKLIDDSDRLLPVIPGVEEYWCGQHGDFGRPTVDRNYDVGLYVRFQTEAEYAAYVEHENHVELVESWRPHMEWIRVHDVVSSTPRP